MGSEAYCGETNCRWGGASREQHSGPGPTKGEHKGLGIAGATQNPTASTVSAVTIPFRAHVRRKLTFSGGYSSTLLESQCIVKWSSFSWTNYASTV